MTINNTPMMGSGLRALVLSSCIAMLAACGGGGGGDSASPASTISGTAAAGAPVVGQVTVKDALGAMRTVDIRSDGGYTVNVGGMTAPFVFRAQGSVGGRLVTLVSAATTADVNGTINITPFTDLIVANMAGQVASNYFDNPDFAQLTPEELNEAKTVLTQRLMPVLSNVGLDAGFDLLRASFNANHTGIDAVLDAVRVTVDPVANTATIRDLVNNHQIIDNLASQTDTTAIATPTASLSGAAADLAAIEAQFNVFNSLFATTLPSPSNTTLRNLLVMDGSFMDGGEDVDTFLNDITTNGSDMLGAALINPVIQEYIDATTIKVGFMFREADGTIFPSLDNDDVLIMKKVDGIWRIAGNGRAIDLHLNSVNLRSLPASNSLFGQSWITNTTTPRYERKLNLWVGYAPVGVDYVRVTAPGFRVGGVAVDSLLLHRSVQMEGFVAVDSQGNDAFGGWIPACDEGNFEICVDFASIADNAQYTVEPLDAAQQAIAGKPAFTLILPKPPVSNLEAATNASARFADFASIQPAGYGSLGDGTNIQLTVVPPTGSGYRLDGANYQGSNAHGSVDLWDDFPSGNVYNFTWNGSAPTSAPSLYVRTSDLYNREYVTAGHHNTQ